MAHTRIYQVSLCITMILIAVAAGWYSLQAHQARSKEGHCMHQALQLTALDVMERTEGEVTQAQALQAQSQAAHAQQESNQLADRAKFDEQVAARDQERGEHLSVISTREQHQANAMWRKVNETESARLELIQKLAAEKESERETIQELRNRQFHDGLCAWRGIEYVCQLVGGLTKLQEEANRMDVQIHRDMQLLSEMEQFEFMEALAAQALQGKADQYKEVSQQLFHAAQLWAEQAQKDREKAIELNDTAQELVQDSVLLEHRSEAYMNATNRMSAESKQLLDAAHAWQNASKKFSVASLVLAASALIFFVLSAVPRLVMKFHDVVFWLKNENNRDNELWRVVGHCTLHVMFFLVSVVWCQDYLYHLDEYGAEKRAVVVTYFALLAAAAQSLCLQAIPHYIEETQANPPDFGLIALIFKYFCLRTLCLMPVFFMELLFVWLCPFRAQILSPTWAQSFVIHLLLVVLLMVHYVNLEPHGEVQTDNDNSTFASLQDDESANESTPLQHHSPTATEIMPQVYLSGQQHIEIGSHYSLESASPYHVDLCKDISGLILPFQVFIAFCMMLVCDIALENLFGNKSSVYVLVLLLTLLGCFAIKFGPTRNESLQYQDSTPPKILYV